MIFSLGRHAGKVLVIGDIMLDTYVIGSVDRISPEAPVPVILKRRERNVPGGAANVAVNMMGAGCAVWIAGFIGDDIQGDILKSRLESCGICTDFIMRSGERNTIRKTRFVTGEGQQLLRMDEEIASCIREDEIVHLLKNIEEAIDSFDVIVLSDYLKGTLNAFFTQGVIKAAKKSEKPVLIDIKDTDISKYKGAFLLKPNRIELKTITGRPADSKENVIKAGQYLRRAAECKYVLATLGSEGMILIGEDDARSYPSVEVEVFDVSGAGDTALAYLAAGIAFGADVSESVSLANAAAGVQVSKSGTSAVYMEEAERIWKGNRIQNSDRKSISYEMLPALKSKMAGRKITFTNGCFDILHVGHIRYLQEASKLGDILVVGLNGDDSVRRLKGASRPINDITDRVEMLAAYPFIDYIIVFDEDTPLKLIKALKPDFLVKGADYQSVQDVVGWDIVLSYGGEVKLIDYTEGKSTTGMIQKIGARGMLAD